MLPQRLNLPRLARGITPRIIAGTLAVLLAATGLTPAAAGAPHHGSAHHSKQDVDAAKKKGGRTKTVKRTFSSEDAIAIPALGSDNDRGAADPYPSTLAVAGFKKARITDVNLTLRALSHTFAPDPAILLVAPGGRNAVVMGNVGVATGSSAVNNITLTLDDEAAAALPAFEQLVSGSFRPVNRDESPSLPDPAPALSGDVALSTFDGINPNGSWQLFIFDNGNDDTGSLADGWSLEITAKAKVKVKSHGKRKR